jgi:phage tail-like protein
VSSRRVRAASSDPAGPPLQPFTNLRFAVAIEGVVRTGAVEVVFPTARIIERARSRSVQFDPMLIRRGLTESTDWFDWWDQARRSARTRRRLVQVILLRPNGSEGLRWFFRDCRPTSYSLSPLNALVGEPVIESLQLQVASFELFRRQ